MDNKGKMCIGTGAKAEIDRFEQNLRGSVKILWDLIV